MPKEPQGQVNWQGLGGEGQQGSTVWCRAIAKEMADPGKDEL